MKIKKLFSIAALSAFLICQQPGTANAYAFVCANCSTNLQQALEYATQLAELAELLSKAGFDEDPASFKRYGSARQLYNFKVDNASAY